MACDEMPGQASACEALEGKPDDDELDFRAPSVHYLQTGFLAELAAAGLPTSSRVYELEEAVIRKKGERLTCPRDGRLGAAYVDAVEGEGATGKANYMLSYTWGYPTSDIIDTLGMFCERHGLDANRVYVWICCLCINQHRVKEARARGATVPFHEFRDTFSRRVRKIGHLLAMMCPWHSPLYVGRVWCVFEFHVAITELRALSVVMPPREEEAFRTDLQCGVLNQVFDTLAGVQIQHALASVEADKANILKTIDPESTDYGASVAVAQLNRAVREKLQAWLVECAAASLEARSQVAPGGVCLEMYCAVGRLLTDSVADFARARKILSSGLAAHPSSSRPRAEGVWLLGRLDAREQRFEDACERYAQAKTMLEALDATATAQFARILVDLGVVGGGLPLYSSAKTVFEATGATADPDYARALKHIGTSHREAGRAAEALATYEQACAVYVTAGADRGPGYADLLQNLGELHFGQGQADGALRCYEAALAVYEAASLENGPGYGRLWILIGDAHVKSEARGKALFAYERARAILEALDREVYGTLIADLDGSISALTRGESPVDVAALSSHGIFSALTRGESPVDVAALSSHGVVPGRRTPTRCPQSARSCDIL